MNHNWQEIVGELNSYVSLAAIYDVTGVPTSTLQDIKTGKTEEPRYGGGQAILRMLGRERAKAARRVGS